MLHPFDMKILLVYVNSTTKFEMVEMLVEYLPVKSTGTGVYEVRIIALTPDDCLNVI